MDQEVFKAMAKTKDERNQLDREIDRLETLYWFRLFDHGPEILQRIEEKEIQIEALIEQERASHARRTKSST